jgi:hypothetical protein
VNSEQLKDLAARVQNNGVWLLGCYVMATFALLVAFLALTWRNTPAEQLDPLAVSLSILQVFLVFVAVTGFWLLRGVVERQSRETSLDVADKVVQDYMAKHGGALIALCLQDAEVVARLQLRFTEIGIDKSNEADYVDNAPNWRPEGK